MGKLSGKIAIVTGSGSGIGQAMVRAFAREGASVVITWRSDEENAQQTAEQIRQAGGRCLVCQLDVTDPASVRALFQRVAAELGVPDILVNNAGIGQDKPFTELSYEKFDSIHRTYLYGPYLCTREYPLRRQLMKQHTAAAIRTIAEIMSVAGVQRNVMWSFQSM